jgi:hypothetical protein
MVKDELNRKEGLDRRRALLLALHRVALCNRWMVRSTTYITIYESQIVSRHCDIHQEREKKKKKSHEKEENQNKGETRHFKASI